MTKRNWIVVAVTTFLMGLWLSLFQEINLDDETWFLQVVRRVLDGEILYRDIYFGATPLSVYVTAFLGSIFGSELWVARFTLVLYFVSGLLLACAILRELGVFSRFSILFILSFFVFAHFQVTWGFSGYNGLAKVFLLSCFLTLLKWNRSFSLKHLLFSSIFAGLCFCSKQNVGLLALLALLLVGGIVCKSRSVKIEEALKQVALILVTFLIVVFAVLLPTIFEGGWENFLDYAWLNKKRYLDAEHCSYFLQLPHFDSYSLLIFCAPALILLGFLFIHFRLQKEDRVPWLILCVFLGAAGLNLYPRPDNFQKMTFVPFLLIFIAYCSEKAKVFFSHVYLRVPMLVWLCIVTANSMIQPLRLLFTNRVIFSHLRHFSCIFVDEAAYRHWKAIKKQVSKSMIGERCFFLSTHGGFYYLLFEKKNPTPFDYPIHTALGCHGENLIINKIQTHAIHALIMDHISWSNWPYMPLDRHPFMLEAFIKDRLNEKKLETSTELQHIFTYYDVSHSF
jgi:hypothetical protein